MELFILQIFAFLRPVFLIELSGRFFGLNVFELVAILLFSMLLAAFVFRVSLSREAYISAIDVMNIAFVLWGIVVYVIYIDKAVVNETAKLLLPFTTYTLAKNLIPNRNHYLRIIFLMIMGFAIPIVYSFVLILQGSGVDYVNYWTSLPRYQGAFENSHQLAHSMTLVLMCVVVYVVLSRERGDKTLRTPRVVFLIAMSIMALVLLQLSYTRTAMLGLVVFLIVYLFLTNKRWFSVVLVAGAIGVLTVVPLDVLFYDFQEAPEPVMEARGGIASGRPAIWGNNIREFIELPIDRQIAGVGIGNLDQRSFEKGEKFLDSHNDYLHVLVQTGVVGFLIFMVIQGLILQRILRLKISERNVFLALFAAVTFMNLASNSYVARFGIAQMYYLLIAYVDNKRINDDIVAISESEGSKKFV